MKRVDIVLAYKALKSYENLMPVIEGMQNIHSPEYTRQKREFDAARDYLVALGVDLRP